MLTLNPSNQPEIMDNQVLDPVNLKKTLSFLHLTHHYFGGEAVFLKKLDHWSRSWSRNRTYTFLDVGTGGGDVSISVARWARKKGFQVKVYAVDKIPTIAEIAQKRALAFPEIQVVCQDVFDFQHTGQKFDYVLSALFLHHIFSPQRAEILRKLDSLAQRGMIMSDLQRTVPSFVAVWTLTRLTGGPVPRHDGPLSVRRAFTPTDLTRLVSKSSLSYLQVRRERWFRISLSGEKHV